MPLFPILGIFFCFILMLSLPLLTWIRFFVWLVVGFAIYFFYGYRHSQLGKEMDEGKAGD